MDNGNNNGEFKVIKSPCVSGGILKYSSSLLCWTHNWSLGCEIKVTEEPSVIRLHGYNRKVHGGRYLDTNVLFLVMFYN